MPASGPPEWGPDDTGAVPVGPEPEPTGVSGSGEGPGGWGGEARLEPFAIAAMVWAVVSIVLPIVGTIVAFVLAARAADSIRRSRGTRSGTNLVVAARVVAGAVIALWAIGLIAFVALGGSDDSNGNKVAVPTQPPITSTTLVPTTSTTIPPTTSTISPTTTTAPPPPTVITVAPPPTQAPTTPPTQAPTTPPTQAPTSPSDSTTTTKPAGTTTTTSPQQRLTARIEERIGASNRGVPADERVVVQYTPGGTVTVTWAINNGTGTLPSGEPTCTAPPPTVTSTTTTTTAAPPPEESTTTSTTSTTTTTTTTTLVPAPPDEPTVQQARREARQILQVLRSDLRQHRIDATGVQLVGTYPITGPDDGDVDVVQVFYWGDELAEKPLPTAAKVFVAPPAAEVQCLNPAFD